MEGGTDPSAFPLFPVIRFKYYCECFPTDVIEFSWLGSAKGEGSILCGGNFR